MAAQPDQGRDQATKKVIEGLKRIYRETILPLEQVRWPFFPAPCLLL